MTFETSIQQLQQQITRACERAGRSAQSVQILPVSKTFGVDAIEKAVWAGCRRFAENRPQELRDKARYFDEHHPDLPLQWVQIGSVQTNKAKEIARHAAELQSLDRLALAEALEKRLQKEGRALDVLIQVKTSREASKAGMAPDAVPDFMQALASFECLRLKGFMTIAEQSPEDTVVRQCFRQLRQIAEQAREASGLPLPELSMGMSADFEIAIEEGATQIRIGSALFGQRGRAPDTQG